MARFTFADLREDMSDLEYNDTYCLACEDLLPSDYPGTPKCVHDPLIKRKQSEAAQYREISGFRGRKPRKGNPTKAKRDEINDMVDRSHRDLQDRLGRINAQTQVRVPGKMD